MRFDIHVHLPLDSSGILGEIRSDLKRLLQMGTKQMADLTRITEAVTGLTSVVDSAVELLGRLAQEIRDNATDPAKLEELASQIEAQKQELAEGIAANTPGA